MTEIVLWKVRIKNKKFFYKTILKVQTIKKYYVINFGINLKF